MKKTEIRIIASILLVITVFNMFFSPISYATNSGVSSFDATENSIGDTLSLNPSVNNNLEEDVENSENNEDGEDAENDDTVSDGERTNDRIDYTPEQYSSIVRDGTAPRREDGSGGWLLSAGRYVLTLIVLAFAGFLSIIPAAVNMIFTFLYWEEPPKDVESEQYKGIRTNLFTLENLFFNRVKLLDANFFRKNADENSVNQKIKDNISTWHYKFTRIALLLILFIMMYLAIKLIIAPIQDNPGARAQAKAMLIDIIISFFLVFTIHYFIAIVLYLTDFLTDIIWEVAKKLLNNDVLNFEKVIIYKYWDLKGVLTQPAEKAINVVSFIVLVWLHIKFLWMFMQRFLTLSFFTIISPFIGIIYAVDKHKDGQTQIFQTWASDVVRISLIVPLYAGMYTVFAVAMGPVAEKAPMLGLLFLLMFGKIEKIIKEVFNLRGLTGVRSSEDYSISPKDYDDDKAKNAKPKKD